MAVPTKPLSNGVQIPMLGIGMDQVKDFAQGYDALTYAFSVGYRSVDTASSYGNEEMVGNALKDSGVPRDALFVTTKLTGADQGYDATLRAFDKSLKRLQLDYLDSYLIHWPGKYLFADTWRAFERLYAEKRIRAIGVCNFNIRHLETLRETSDVTPMMNQIEFHPYFIQNGIADYCQKAHILLEAWSPLMCGGDILEDQTIRAIAADSGKTPAQVILRWHLQSGRRVFPKSVTPSRIKENFEVFDFALTDAQMAAINALGSNNVRIGPDPDIFFEN